MHHSRQLIPFSANCNCFTGTLQARKQFPMLAEFAARMNCGGVDVASTADFMRQMMQSQTRPSYDNVIATQTFGDDEEEEEVYLHSHEVRTVFSNKCHCSQKTHQQ